jgi:uncharacterized damage-inducible protein DinB
MTRQTPSDARVILLTSLDEAYEKKSWHGPNVRGALRGVSAEESLQRPARGRHNIWELAAHLAYWKHIVRRRLLRIRGPVAFPGSNWLASPAVADEAGWRELIQLLGEEQRALREVVAAMTVEDLRDPKKIHLVHGAVSHDLYHTGQIQLVKRLIRAD